MYQSFRLYAKLVLTVQALKVKDQVSGWATWPQCFSSSVHAHLKFDRVIYIVFCLIWCLRLLNLKPVPVKQLQLWHICQNSSVKHDNAQDGCSKGTLIAVMFTHLGCYVLERTKKWDQTTTIGIQHTIWRCSILRQAFPIHKRQAS